MGDSYKDIRGAVVMYSNKAGAPLRGSRNRKGPFCTHMPWKLAPIMNSILHLNNCAAFVWILHQ